MCKIIAVGTRCQSDAVTPRLQVNFRGSTGFGKSFLHKGDKQWGVGTMQVSVERPEWCLMLAVLSCLLSLLLAVLALL